MRIPVRYLILWLLSLLPLCAIAAPPVPISPDAYHLMELNLSDRTQLSDGFTIYAAGGDWWIPLGELSELLGLAIHVSPAEFLADGYVFSEDRPFHQNGHKCTIEHDRQKQSYECSAATVFGDEIFILSSVIQKWLPVELKVDSVRSTVTLTPREKLPFQLRREREDLAGRSKFSGKAYDSGFPEQKVPYGIFEGPALDETLSMTRDQQGSSSALRFQHSSEIGAEVLGLETNGYVGGTEKTIDQWRLQLSRKDPKNQMLGPLGLSRIDLLDVDLPGLPLISSGSSGKGFFLTSVPLDTPINFETQDFYGSLPSGWEVILFRNEVLIDRVVSQTDGRYAFKSIPLVYGKNIFKFSFYGPHGERRDEFKTFNIATDLVQAGKGVYSLGLASVRAEEGNKELRQRTVFQFTQGISQHFSLSTGFLHEGTSAENYGYAGITGVNRLFLFFTNCALSSTGGKACEWGEEMGLGQVALGAKYSRFFDYQSQLFKGFTESPLSNLNVHSSFAIPTTPSIGTTWEMERKTFARQDSNTKLRNRLVSSIGSFGINHEANYEFSAVNPYSGRLDLSLYRSPFHVRALQDYSLKRLLGWEIETGFAPAANWSVTAKLKYPIETAQLIYGLSVASFLRACTLSFDSQYASPNKLSLGLTVSFSLMRDPATGEFNISRASMVYFGSASVFVFLDKNRNGIWDQGELALPNLRVMVNQSEEMYKTNAEGHVFISGLSPFRPSDISLSYSSLNNPVWKPGVKGVRFFPRSSKTFQVQYPVVIVGAIDGTVTRAGEIPANRVKLQLLDQNRKLILETKTDREGYYTFEDLAPGRYFVRVGESGKYQGGQVQPSVERAVSIAEEGSFEGGQDFVLPNS